jgi:hypothetical protein
MDSTMKYRIAALPLLAVLGSQMASSQMQFSAPRSGVYFDRARGEVLPIVGIPGAAYLGAPYLSGIQKASVAANSASVLASQEGTLYLITNLADQPDWLALQPAPEDLLLAWAPDSSTFAAYSAESATFNLYRADGTPSGISLDLEGIPGRIVAIHIASGGRVIAVAEDEQGAGAYLLADGEPAIPLVRVASIRLIAVAEDGGSVIAAHPESKQLTEVRNLQTHPQTLTHTIAEEIGQDLTFVVFSSMTRTAFLSSAGPEPALVSFDLAAGEISRKTMLDSAATEFEWLEGGRRLLLRDAHGGVSLVLPGSAARAFLVPSGPAIEQ